MSIDGGANSCNNNFLGYYYWSWFVDDAGHLTDEDIIESVAWENLHIALDDAVAAWNTQAPGSAITTGVSNTGTAMVLLKLHTFHFREN